MTKYLTWAAAVLLSSSAVAQDLANRIPDDAFAVATVNSNHLFELLNTTEFNESVFGRALFRSVSEDGGGKPGSIEDFGFNLQATIYFFSQATDSIHYYGLLVPLADPSKLEQAMKGAGAQITTDGDLKKLNDSAGSDAVMWSKEGLFLLSGSLNSSFFQDSVVAERYGIQNVSYAPDALADYPMPADSVVSDTMPVDTVATPADDYLIDIQGSAEGAYPSASADTVVFSDNYSSDIQGSTNGVFPAPADTAISADGYPVTTEGYDDEDITDTAASVVEAPYAVAPVYSDSTYAETYGDSQYDDYYKSYSADDSIKNELKKVWILEQAKVILLGPGSQVSTGDRPFMKNHDSKALATLWVRDMNEIYSQFIPEVYTAMLGRLSTGIEKKSFTGLGSVNASLYVDGDQIKLTSAVAVSKEMAASYRKIYSRKINRKFLKYVNSDEVAGLFGFAVDTRAYLEEFPRLMQQTYGNLFGMYAEEIDLGTSLFSILLDEKAVGKMLKGDGLILLRGMTQQDVTYTAYDYDENYNTIEVEKTKKEYVPDFLAMVSSDDSQFFQKLLQYGISKNKVSEQDGIYSITDEEIPVDLYVLFKDKIAFLGTSLSELQQINAGRSTGSISAKHREMLKTSQMAAILNSKRVGQAMDESHVPESRMTRQLRSLFGSMGDFYLTSKKVKGNKISGEFIAEVPDAHENGLKYLLSLFGTTEW